MTTATLQARLMPAMTVKDLKASMRFYTEGLGFTISEKMEEEGEVKGVMLQAGDAHLGLSQDDFSKGRDRVKGVGMRFYFETDQDITALAGKAKDAGITLESGPGPLPWGPTGFTVTDPDGFKLTISNPEKS
jgi:lactoylglutathione lyase